MGALALNSGEAIRANQNVNRLQLNFQRSYALKALNRDMVESVQHTNG
jgi:hypothetical protein